MTDRITGGIVAFEQSRKLAEYENRKASISFSVASDEDATAALNKASNLAVTHVYRLLGIPLDTTLLVAGVEVAGAAPTKTRTTKAKAEPATIKVEGKVTEDAATIVNDAKEVAGAPAKEVAAISTGGERVDPNDPAAMTGFNIDDLDKPALQDITDQALTDAITRKGNELMASLTAAKQDATKAPVAIRNLRAKFGVTPPKKTADMAKEVRSQFLTELEALTV